MQPLHPALVCSLPITDRCEPLPCNWICSQPITERCYTLYFKFINKKKLICKWIQQNLIYMNSSGMGGGGGGGGGEERCVYAQEVSRRNVRRTTSLTPDGRRLRSRQLFSLADVKKTQQGWTWSGLAQVDSPTLRKKKKPAEIRHCSLITSDFSLLGFVFTLKLINREAGSEEEKKKEKESGASSRHPNSAPWSLSWSALCVSEAKQGLARSFLDGWPPREKNIKSGCCKKK